MYLPSHVEPLVFECVQRVQHTHLYERQGVSDDVNGNIAHGQGLQQEQQLYGHAEYGIGQYHAQFLSVDWPAPGVSVRRVGNVLTKK